MKFTSVPLHRLALCSFLLAACEASDSGRDDLGDGIANADNGDPEPEPDMDEPPKVDRFWYSSCGDPDCDGYGGPWPDVPPCGDIEEGDPCDRGGATCDFMSECNAVMVCAGQDPKQREGGCPESG